MTRYRIIEAAAAAAVIVLTAAACGDDTKSGGDKIDVKVADTSFAAGTTMAKLSDAGEITIGVKVDQPGIGFLQPGDDAPEGFDIEMGRIIAAALGIDESDITWKETISDNRESFIKNGTDDIVIASYSITDERRALVGQAGPYYVTGAQLLVRQDDAKDITGPDDLDGVKVCSVEGSTSLAIAQDEYGADPTPLGTYSECVDALQNKTTDAVLTDGAILLGYAAEDPDNLEVVGKPFSEERYGIGYQKGDTEFCQFLTDTIETAVDDGSWQEAFDATLGKSGVEAPEPPKLDPCQ